MPDNISIRQMADSLAQMEARGARMELKIDELTSTLRALFSHTARFPDGRTLINAVGQILHELEND